MVWGGLLRSNKVVNWFFFSCRRIILRVKAVIENFFLYELAAHGATGGHCVKKLFLGCMLRSAPPSSLLSFFGLGVALIELLE